MGSIRPSKNFSSRLGSLRDNLSNLIVNFSENTQKISDDTFNQSLNPFKLSLNKLEKEIEKFITEKTPISENIIIRSSVKANSQNDTFYKMKGQEIIDLLEKINELNNLKAAGPFRNSLEDIQTQLDDLLINEDQGTYYSCINVFKDELVSLETRINNYSQAITNNTTDVPTWDFSDILKSSVEESLINPRVKTSFEDIEPQRLKTHFSIDGITKKFSSDERNALWDKMLKHFKDAVNEAQTVEELSTLQSIFEYKVKQYNQRIKQVLGAVNELISCNPTFPENLARAANQEEIDKIIRNALLNTSCVSKVSLLKDSRATKVNDNIIVDNNFNDFNVYRQKKLEEINGLLLQMQQNGDFSFLEITVTLKEQVNAAENGKKIDEAFGQYNQHKNNLIIDMTDDDDQDLQKALEFSRKY